MELAYLTPPPKVKPSPVSQSPKSLFRVSPFQVRGRGSWPRRRYPAYNLMKTLEEITATL